jgi:hypothetical protein
MESMLRAVQRADSRRIWTTRRKLIANILPLACGAPFLVAAGRLWIIGWGWYAVALAATSLLVSAVSLNWHGLAGNSAMKRELRARLKPDSGAVFVGFSGQDYFDILDPHEDLGFLQIEAESLVISGESTTVSFKRTPRLMLKFGFNPHSVLGLGRWLVIQGTSEAGPLTLMVEPRELGSLRANRALGGKLKKQIETWIAS